MIDLTFNEKDKDTFITKVYLSEESPEYYIKYASGRTSKQEFTVHNFNATLLAMEQQYNRYKEEFFYTQAKLANRAVINKFVEGFLAIIGIFLTINFDISVIIKIFLSLLIIILSIFYQKSETDKNAKCGRSIDVLAIAEKFLENKDQFKIKVLDPITNKEEDWYLLNLSDIELLSDKYQVTLFGASITDEIRAEESKNTMNTLKKKWNIGD